MTVLTDELRTWLRQGLPGVVATVGADRRPEIVRVWAVRAVEGCDRLEAYVLRAGADRFLERLAEGTRVALNVIELPSYVSRAFKGTCEPFEEALDEAFHRSRLAAMNDAIVRVGMPDDAVERMRATFELPHRTIGLRIAVDGVFDQSPKPGAGARL